MFPPVCHFMFHIYTNDVLSIDDYKSRHQLKKKKAEDALGFAASNIPPKLKSLCKSQQAHSSNRCTNLLSSLEVKLRVY